MNLIKVVCVCVYLSYFTAIPRVVVIASLYLMILPWSSLCIQDHHAAQSDIPLREQKVDYQ